MKKCASSNRNWDSNSWPSDYESSLLTTRQGIPPQFFYLSVQIYVIKRRIRWNPVVNLKKHFKIVIYTLESYWLQNCTYYDSRVVIYDRKMFIRLDTDLNLICGKVHSKKWETFVAADIGFSKNKRYGNVMTRVRILTLRIREWRGNQWDQIGWFLQALNFHAKVAKRWQFELFWKTSLLCKSAVTSFWATCKLLGYSYFILSKQ